MANAGLSRRERQIMDAIYRVGEAGVAEVRAEIPDPPGYSAVRALLRILEEKGHLNHRQEGPRYVYSPVRSRAEAQDSALRRVLQTFFDDSTEKAVAALLDLSSENLSDEELQRLSKMIDAARGEGR